VSTELRRHVGALVSELAAEYGEVDLVGRRTDCTPREYDALVESFSSVGVVGGAGVRVGRDGRTLLARYGRIDGWIEPGAGRRPGESYRECAERGFEAATGLAASIEDLAQVQLVYLDDSTGRVPVPNPYLSFSGTVGEGEPTPGDGVVSLRWAATPPAELAYGELAELPLGASE